MNADSVVHVRGLKKSYGEFEAVKGIDFELRSGEVFGLHGAGRRAHDPNFSPLPRRSLGQTMRADALLDTAAARFPRAFIVDSTEPRSTMAAAQPSALKLP